MTGAPLEIEGIARVDHDTLALVNDNDFGMTDGADAFAAQGRLVSIGIETTPGVPPAVRGAAFGSGRLWSPQQ
ncbi:hypothetical protein ABT075_16330 [Streptomyces sp. NPDC002677]|uniref:hypothetical protein n=1 Tax=Streptomyces sp. NPDC002677 TaxID=3154774 RepID=UPI0033322AB6